MAEPGSGGKDHERGNVKQDYELQAWAKRFGVPKADLMEAVKEVGDRGCTPP